MADTPRRKRKTKAPASVFVLPQDTDEPIYANIIVDVDELHAIMTALAASIAMASSESEDDPEMIDRIDQTMKVIWTTGPQKVEALIIKLNRAHSATCRHAQQEERESLT